MLPLAAKLHRSSTSSTLQLSVKVLLRTFAACDLRQARRQLFGTLALDEKPEARHLEKSETQPLERALPSTLDEAVENTQDGHVADRLRDASAEPKLTHVDSSGKAAMVGVGLKESSSRYAAARGYVWLGQKAYTAVKQNSVRKGDVLAVARVAGIMGAKQTSQLIPLCHNIPLDQVRVNLSLDPERTVVKIWGEAWCHGKTGVEMEALTAVTTAALTVYDMCKGISKHVAIQNVFLVKKSGGKSKDWVRGPSVPPASPISVT